MAAVTFHQVLDFSRLGTLSFTLTEAGGGGATGTVSITSADAKQMLGLSESVVLTASDLLATLKTKLEAVGNATYTVTCNHLSSTSPRIVITASGGGVTAIAINTFNSVAQRVLGFTTNRSGSIAYTADQAPGYFMVAEQGFISDWVPDLEDAEGIADDFRAHDGTPYGQSKDDTTTLVDFTVPIESASRVWNAQASPTATTPPYTWQRFFKDARNTEVIAIQFNGHTAWPNSVRYVRLRADGCVFAPTLRTANYYGNADISIKAAQLPGEGSQLVRGVRYL
jgi:hypothetical protein